MQKVIAISGYFIIFHVGHLQYIREASKYGKVVIILNNDDQQFLKYGKVIVPLKERAEILNAIPEVHAVYKSIDKDRTVCETLKRIKPDMFGNGGDRNNTNIPEIDICENQGIQMIFGLGKKIQSSSWLMKKINEKN